MSAASPTPSHEDRRRQAVRMLLQYEVHGRLSDEEAQVAAGTPRTIIRGSASTPVPFWCRCRDLRRMDLIRPVVVVRDGVRGYLARRGASGTLRVLCELTVRGRAFVKRLKADIRAEWPAAPDKPGDPIGRLPRHEADPPGPPWNPTRK